MTPCRVGVTGHRKLGEDPREIQRVFEECRRILQETAAPGRGVEAYSLLAVGADQIFARAALDLQLPLVGVLPFEAYADDFRGDARREFEDLVNRCVRLVRLPIPNKSLEAYMAGGRALVDATDVLIAVWNGLPSRNLGGTGDVVAYARSMGRPVRIIEVPR